jgi:NADPH:quinone reductase-like Zn-dependent oxidoreductase
MHGTGDPDVLRVEEADRPEPGAGEVLIRVRAAAVNPIDWKQRRGVVGVRLPAVLGVDVSGTVEVSRAAGFAVGEEVFGVPTSGGYAELATAAAAAVAPKPAGLSHDVAAALPTSGTTAWQGLFERGRLERGQTVVVAGAAGGVGHLAVQLARHAGALVVATASGPNRELVLGLGADTFVDYTRERVEDVVRGTADVVLDTVGGANTASLVPALREGGILVTVAYPPEEPPAARGVRVEPLSMRSSPEQLAQLAALVAEGALHVEIAAVLPLAGVRRAHELSESGHVRGKIVLRIGE